MKTDNILQADLLDIIFDNKNKNYGAYALRKFYDNRLYKALAISLSIGAIFCCFAFLNKPSTIKMGWIVKDETTLKQIEHKQEKKIGKPVEIKKPRAASNAAKNLATQAHVIPTITKTPIDFSPIKDLKDNVPFDVKDNIGDRDVVQKVNDLVGIKKDTGNAKSNIVIIDKNKPLDIADVQPEYPGGMKALREFLQKNLTNPQEMEQGEKVTVKIKFVVGYDGKLKAFETMEDGGELFNNEVIRVLKKMPNWIPGKIGTESVSIYYQIPVSFVSPD
jgi:periplasmic protein TonB